MESRLFKYIWVHSKREQVIILLIVLLSQLFYFVSLDLPKAIVNKAIQGEAFQDGNLTTPFLQVTITPPGFLAGLLGTDPITIFPGLQLDQISYLVALCMMFLVLVPDAT